MKTNGAITFEKGCELYLQKCKERNRRDDTIRYYCRVTLGDLRVETHLNRRYNYNDDLYVNVIFLIRKG